MEVHEFQVLLSKVGSRLRHDLKGGLITLKMGLESLPDEEALKPLLLEKSQELVDLADKLVLLLKMSQIKSHALRPGSLFAQAAGQAEALFTPLRVRVEAERLAEDERWDVDPDAVTYAVLEICQNAKLAGATEVVVELVSGGIVRLSNSGQPPDGSQDPAQLTEVGVSHWGRSGLGLAVVERCMSEHGGGVVLHPRTDGLMVELKFGTERSSG